MVSKRLHFWVILICVGAASGLLSPQNAQALGCWGGGCGGGFGGCWGGGCGGGLFGGVGLWGGGCGCGPRVKYKYKMKCKQRRRWAPCGCDGYAGSVGGGCGCGAGVGAGGYSTGVYGSPEYDPNMSPNWSPAPSTIESVPQPNYIPSPAPAQVPPSPDTPPAPAPDQTSRTQRQSQRAFALQNHQVGGRDEASGIVVYVPEDAQVFVNDRPMKTKGTERRFSADRLQEGKVYEYDIRAEMVRNGAKLVRTEHVALKAGHLEEVAFDFSDTVAPIQTVQGLFPETKLTVIVPEDASVYLAGEDTISVGKVRQFVTDELANGKAWKDYEVRVEVERNGKTVVKSKKISLFAGEDKEVVFKFDVDKKVASTR